MSEVSIEEQLVQIEERMAIITHTLNNQGNYNMSDDDVEELNTEYAELEAELQGIKFFQSLDNKGVDKDSGECVACQG